MVAMQCEEEKKKKREQFWGLSLIEMKEISLSSFSPLPYQPDFFHFLIVVIATHRQRATCLKWI